MHHSRILRNVRLGIKGLLLHKLRSMLTILGVVFGVGSVIAMLSVGEGASEKAMEQIRKLGSNNIIIESVKPPDEPFEVSGTRQPMTVYGLLYDDEARIAKTIPTIKQTVAAKMIRKEARIGDRVLELRIVGTTPAWFDLVRRELLAGRVLLPTDEEEYSHVCVLTEHGRGKLLGARHAIGEVISIDGASYRVVGVVRNETGSSNLPDEQVDVYIPLSVARTRFGDRHRAQTGWEWVELHRIIVEVGSTREVPPTAEAIRTMLRRFHKTQDYKVIEPVALLRQARETKRTFNIVLGSIAGISLLVGGIGIMNIMLASVTERTREIGIRRAIGAKRRQIIAQFLIETMVLSSVGGLLGVTLGPTLAWGISISGAMPVVVPLYSILLSLGISVAVGVVFGLYPAVRAARLDPIVALRHE